MFVAGERPATVEAVEEPRELEVGMVCVLTVGEQFKVVELVVLFVAVNVVDVLAWKQGAVELDFHEEAVEGDGAATANGNHDVALVAEGASTVRLAEAGGAARRPGA